MNIHSIVRQINRDLVQFEERLRLYMQNQDKDWLIEQIVLVKKATCNICN